MNIYLVWMKLDFDGKNHETSYMHKEVKAMIGFKATCPLLRITLLLLGDAIGFKLKPLMIYGSEKLRALKNFRKNSLAFTIVHTLL